MQSQANNDQVPHLVIQSDEEIYQKFQELKEKVVNLKESNRIIESRLDVLCRGVGDREQTQCSECKRQKEDEAELVKALQEKAKALEEQERQHEDEMKKLGESLKTVMTNFDKLLEIAKKSKWEQEDLATVHSETRRVGSFENKGSTSQDITQADCAQPIDMNIDKERNCDDTHKLGSCSDNHTESTQKLSAKSDHGCLTEDVGHSQNSGASRERGTDSVIASVQEIHEIQPPGPQQTLNQQAKDSSSDKNRSLKVEITGDNVQEARQPVKDTKAGVAVENSSSEHGSIKNPNFQRKSQNSGSKESQQHQQFGERS